MLASRFFLRLFLTILFGVFLSLFFPSIRLLYFAPLIASCFYQKRRIFVLWVSCLSGLFLDAASSDIPFGLTAFAYTAASFFILELPLSPPERPWIFITLYTALFSALSTLILLLTLPLFSDANISFQTFFTDALLYPIADALYALVCFSWTYAFVKSGRSKKGFAFSNNHRPE